MALAEEEIPLVLYIGGKLDKTFVWKNKETGVPYNLTGYKAHMQIREAKDDADAKFTLSTEAIVKDGTLTLGGVGGTIAMFLGSDVTKDISGWSSGFYDVLLYTTTTDAFVLFEGKVAVKQVVTRV
ncbi:MAG: hypothetical protein ACWGQW_01220 [bacterium]